MHDQRQTKQIAGLAEVMERRRAAGLVATIVDLDGAERDFGFATAERVEDFKRRARLNGLRIKGEES